MSAPRVLVVDEEAGIGRGLQIMVRSAGYTAEVAGTRLDVLARVIASPPDAMLLDLVRADGRAVELCGEVRRSSELPILALSAVGDAHERTRALDAGADDFVIRPFGVDELLARLEAVLRQPAELEGNTRFEIGELVIDVTERRVFRGDEDVPLTPLEFELLCVVARYHGRLVTDRQLLRALWGPECISETRALRVLVAASAASSSAIHRAPSTSSPNRARLPAHQEGVRWLLRGGVACTRRRTRPTTMCARTRSARRRTGGNAGGSTRRHTSSATGLHPSPAPTNRSPRPHASGSRRWPTHSAT